MNERKAYPTDLNDKQWAVISPLLPKSKMGRPRKYSEREMLNGILYILRTGCSWRMMPHDLPPWDAVYQYFRKLQKAGTWRDLNNTLRGKVRVAVGRDEYPSTLIADSQSVKTTEKGGFVAMMEVSE